MTKPNHWIVKASLLLLTYCLACSRSAQQQAPVTTVKDDDLYFYTVPPKQLFWLGESVVIELQLYSRSEQPILVGQLQDDELVRFKVTGPDGNEIPWQGKARSSTKRYAPKDFIELKQWKQITTDRTISLKDGEGFVFNKPGEYTLTAEYSMGPPEKLAPFAGSAKILTRPLHSSKLSFCIDACIQTPLEVRNNAPVAALDAVNAFYTKITKSQQFGIPYGRDRKAIQPLLSKRLALVIDALGACNDDYFRRFSRILRENTSKPAIPWGEAGLFTGPEDASTPTSFRILGSRVVGENRVDVLMAFKEDWGESEGDVTAILENNRWVIDDYVAMYENDELQRLSDGYPECKDGKWVSTTY